MADKSALWPWPARGGTKYPCGHEVTGALPHPDACPLCPKPLTFDDWWQAQYGTLITPSNRVIAKAAWDAAKATK